MDKALIGAVVGALLASCFAYANGYLQRRGQLAAERPLSEHWKRFVVGRGAAFVITLCNVTTVAWVAWFIWSQINRPADAPVTRIDLLSCVTLAVIISTALSGFMAHRLWDSMERLIAALRDR